MLDSNLLFDIVLYEFAGDAGPAQKAKALGALKYINSAIAYDRFRKLCQARRTITTSLVLAEIGSLARRNLWPRPNADGEAHTWRFLRKLDAEVRRLDLSVQTAPESPVGRQARERLGPTDANLIDLTLTREKGAHESERAELLTADRPLADWCSSHGIKAHYFDPRLPGTA